MNLITEKEKAIEKLENKINNIKEEYDKYKQNKEKEINDMKNKVAILLDKVNILEKKKVLLKDYNQLKAKSDKYDDLNLKYQKLKKIVDEKWDLSEQQYLDIIATKDDEILRLKEALILSERQSMINGNNTMKYNNCFGYTNSIFNNNGNESFVDNLPNLTNYENVNGTLNLKNTNISNILNNSLFSTSDVIPKEIKEEDNNK